MKSGHWYWCLQCNKAFKAERSGDVYRCMHNKCAGRDNDLWEWEIIRALDPALPETPAEDTQYIANLNLKHHQQGATQPVGKILVVCNKPVSCCETIHYAITQAWKHKAELVVLLPDGTQKLSVKTRSTLTATLRDVRVGGLQVKEVKGQPADNEQLRKMIAEEKIDLLILHTPEDAISQGLSEEQSNDIPCRIGYVSAY